MAIINILKISIIKFITELILIIFTPWYLIYYQIYIAVYLKKQLHTQTTILKDR